MDDFTKLRITKIMRHYTANRVPKHVQSQLRLGFKLRGNFVTLVEERPAFRGEGWTQMNNAQFRRDEQGLWKVYWQDSKDKWHWVEQFPPCSDFEQQLSLVDKDDSGIFWG